MATTRKPAPGSRQAKTVMVRARIDPELKRRAESILDDLGLNASDAIRLFYTQITLSDGLPFEVRIPNAETREAIREATAGREVTTYESTDQMYHKFDI